MNMQQKSTLKRWKKFVVQNVRELLFSRFGSNHVIPDKLQCFQLCTEIIHTALHHSLKYIISHCKEIGDSYMERIVCMQHSFQLN